MFFYLTFILASNATPLTLIQVSFNEVIIIHFERDRERERERERERATKAVNG